MTLVEHARNVAKLIEECRTKGVDPEKVEIFTTDGASGDCNELSNGYLRFLTGEEESGPVIDLPVGTPIIDFYSGN